MNGTPKSRVARPANFEKSHAVKETVKKLLKTAKKIASFSCFLAIYYQIIRQTFWRNATLFNLFLIPIPPHPAILGNLCHIPQSYLKPPTPSGFLPTPSALFVSWSSCLQHELWSHVKLPCPGPHFFFSGPLVTKARKCWYFSRLEPLV